MGLSESCRCSGTSPSPGGTELHKSLRPGPGGAWSAARRGWMAWKVSQRRYDFPGYGEWCHPTQVAPMVKNYLPMQEM